MHRGRLPESRDASKPPAAGRNRSWYSPSCTICGAASGSHAASRMSVSASVIRRTPGQRVELRGKGEVEQAAVWHAGAEVGQGTHTIMRQFAAGALGLPVEKVSLLASDTASMESSGSCSASRMTFMAGNAIKGASEAALARWKAEERPAVAEYTYLAPKTTPFDRETGYSVPNLSYAYVAQAVEVEVDTETGFVKVLRVVSADDVGRRSTRRRSSGRSKAEWCRPKVMH